MEDSTRIAAKVPPIRAQRPLAGASTDMGGDRHAKRGEGGHLINHLLAEEKNKKSKRAHAELVIKTFPEGILAGAIGAALLGAYRYDQLEKKGRADLIAAAAAAAAH